MLSTHMTVLEALKDIHRRCAFVKHPNGLEIYAIYFHDLLPIIEANKILSNAWKKDEGFRSVRERLEMESHRLLWLNNPNSVYLGAFKTDLDVALKQLVEIASKNGLNDKKGETIKLGAPSKYTFDGTFLWLGKTSKCKIPANTFMASLCRIFFRKEAKKVLSIPWEEVYEFAKGVPSKSNEDYKQIGQWVIGLNKKLAKENMPKALSFSGGMDGQVTKI